MARKRRHYSDEDRATLVAMVMSEGYPESRGAITRVARYAQVPERTIRHWVKETVAPPPAKLVEKKKGTIAEKLAEFIHAAIDHANNGHNIAEMTAKEAIVAAAIAIDKKRLLENESTENVTAAVALHVIYDGND